MCEELTNEVIKIAKFFKSLGYDEINAIGYEHWEEIEGAYSVKVIASKWRNVKND